MSLHLFAVVEALGVGQVNQQAHLQLQTHICLSIKVPELSAINISWGTALFYLCDCLQLYTPSRTLRSASDTLSLQIPRTRLSTVGSRAFSVFGPSTWNDLALPLRQKPSLDSFRCNSKHFFSPNYRPAMFSLPCCCRHPSQVCLLPVLSRVN